MSDRRVFRSLWMRTSALFWSSSVDAVTWQVSPWPFFVDNTPAISLKFSVPYVHVVCWKSNYRTHFLTADEFQLMAILLTSKNVSSLDVRIWAHFPQTRTSSQLMNSICTDVICLTFGDDKLELQFFIFCWKRFNGSLGSRVIA